MNIIQKIVYGHLSVINKYPKGISNRFQNNADKWVQSLDNPHIKTYHQFFLNQQTHKYKVRLLQTQKQQLHLKQISQKDRAGLFRFFQIIKIFHPYRIDDHLPSIDTKNMTLVKFIKEAISQRKQHHLYPFWWIAFIILQVTCYFLFVHGENIVKKQKIIVGNAELLQVYHFQDQQRYLKQVRERLEMVNGQYLKQLQNAKSSK